MSCPRSYLLNTVSEGVCQTTTTHQPHCDYYSTYTDLRDDGRCYREESGEDGCFDSEEMTTIVSEWYFYLVCCVSWFPFAYLPDGVCRLSVEEPVVNMRRTWDRLNPTCAIPLTLLMILHCDILFEHSSPIGRGSRMYPHLNTRAHTRTYTRTYTGTHSRTYSGTDSGVPVSFQTQYRVHRRDGVHRRRDYHCHRHCM